MLSWVLSRTHYWSDISLLFWILISCVCLTYVIPSGEFERTNGLETQIIPESFQTYKKHFGLQEIIGISTTTDKGSPISIVDALIAIPRGIADSADLIIMLLICGAVVGVLHASGWIDGAIARLIHRFGKRPYLLTFAIFTVLAMGASTIGICEELIPLLPVILLLSQRLGYDALFGLSLLYISTTVGYAGAITNPFNVFTAQTLADIPLNSGWPLRLIFFIVCLGLTLFYLYWYGSRNFEKKECKPVDSELHATFSRHHFLTSIMVMGVYTTIMIGVTFYDWSLEDMTAGYLVVGILAILINRLNFRESFKAIVKGIDSVIISIITIGFTRAIQIIFEEGMVLDTLIYYGTVTLEGLPKVMALGGLHFFQCLLGLLIPSSSGQAMATIPLVAPISDLVGISRQICVLSFQFNSILDMINPTNGMLLVVLRMAGISYKRWFKFVLPLFLMLLVLTLLFLLIALVIGYA